MEEQTADPAAEFESQERRASLILRRLKACEQYVASAGSTFSKRESNGIRDWVLSVHLVLRRVGLTGTAILTFRLTRQQHSQANGFKQIAVDVSRLRRSNGLEAITAEEAELCYLLALEEFLRLMTTRNIADDYRDQIILAA